MERLLFLLGILRLLAATAAVYKQWIPNTNFETASNWDKARVPCARDVVHFDKDKVVSVFVRSPHALTDMAGFHQEELLKSMMSRAACQHPGL